MPLPLSLAVFMAGLLVAAVGGNLFLRGVVDLARWLRVPPGIIGVTVAAFATSTPELAVSITAASRDQPEIGVGDALGSNVVNAGLVLGMALLYAPLKVAGRGLHRDRAAALAAPIVTAAFLLDGTLSRAEAGALLAGFLGWLIAVVRDARRHREERPIEEAVQLVPMAFSLLGGVVALLGAGHLAVVGARGIGGALGLSAFVTGATLVAVGTSIPELVTTVIAARRGHDDVSVGTILGSNLFNGLLIVGVSGTIHPARLAWREVAVSLAFGVLTTLLMIPGADGILSHRRGGALVLAYVAYIALVVQSGQS